MPNLQIFGAGIQGRSPVVTAQRRLNAYLDIEPEADRSKVTFHGLPGLVAFCDLGDTPIRGLYSHGPFLYAVHRDTLYRIRNDGVETVLGTLNTSEGPVYFTANNAGQIMLADGVNGYVQDTVADSFSQIGDADLEAPRHVTVARGHGVTVYGDIGRWQISAADDFTAWDGLDFSTADAAPDPAVAALFHSDVLGLFGTQTVEYWAYTGAGDFPFGRVAGSSYGWGLAAQASLARFGTGAIALMQQDGEIMVATLLGGEPVNVSPPELVAVFKGYTRWDDAVGTVFGLNGHRFYQLTFPAAGATWVYDGRTGTWSERQSHGLTTHRGLHGATHAGKVYWGDVADGRIWRQDTDTWTDGGDPLVWQLRSAHLYRNNARLRLHELQFDFAEGTGTATGQGSDPAAMLRISRDKGRSWGAELRADIGQLGETTNRARFTRLGQARDFVLELSISDPIPRVLTGEMLRVGP